MNNNHLWTLFDDAHWRSLDNICSHPLEAQEIEDLAEDLGLQAVADQLRSNREEKEARDNEQILYFRILYSCSRLYG